MWNSNDWYRFLAFINLNKVMPSAGTSYTWVSNIWGKNIGFITGWSLLSAVCIFMVSATLPISNATLLLLYPSMVNNVNAIAFLSVVWLSFVSLIVIKGIKVSSWLQSLITILEMIVLFFILIFGFLKFYKMPVQSFDWGMLSFADLNTSIFVSGSLIALFFYWGWDVILNLSEETKNKKQTPATAALLAITSLILIFVAFTFISIMGLTTEEISSYNTNILFALTEKIFGASYGYIAVVVVLLSTLGTIETGMLQFTRTLFAKSRDGALHSAYSKLHNDWQTPWVASVTIWFIGILLVFLSTYIKSVNNILYISIGAIGVQISFYLGMTALACAYYYRHSKVINIDSFKSLIKEILYRISHVYYPLFSGVFLIYIGIESLISFDNITRLIGIGGIATGLIPILFKFLKNKIA